MPIDPEFERRCATARMVAEKISAQFGQKPGIIVMRPEDWVGTEEVQDFLRMTLAMKDSAKGSNLLIRAAVPMGINS